MNAVVKAVCVCVVSSFVPLVNRGTIQCSIHKRNQNVFCNINFANLKNGFAIWSAHSLNIRIDSKCKPIALSISSALNILAVTSSGYKGPHVSRMSLALICVLIRFMLY